MRVMKPMPTQPHIVLNDEVDQLLLTQVTHIAVDNADPMVLRRQPLQDKGPKLRNKVVGHLVVRHIQENMHRGPFLIGSVSANIRDSR